MEIIEYMHKTVAIYTLHVSCG